MILLTEVIGEEDDSVVCRAHIGADFAFLRNGEADMAVCMELVAQAVACWVGLVDLRAGRKPKLGLLVGCRDAQFAKGKLRLGDELVVRAKRVWIRQPAASFTGDVTRDGDVIAKMELTVVSGDAHELLAATRAER